MLILTFNNNEEKAIKKVIAALANEIEFEILQSAPYPMLSFLGLEIKQNQHRVFQDGAEVNLTHLEYFCVLCRTA